MSLRRFLAAACVLVLLLGGVAAVPDPGGEALPNPGTLFLAGIAGSDRTLGSVQALPPGARIEYLGDSTVARSAFGDLVFGQEADRWDLYARSRLNREAHQVMLVYQRWLAAGTVPGRTPVEQAMARRALLDLRLLTRPGGAVAAAWHGIWRYDWPRDASWVAAAFAATGHPEDAVRVLGFLARGQRPDGTWEARYHLTGAPVLDGRRFQLDACGWVPWAVWFWYAYQPAGDPAARADLEALWPMVARAADAAARSLDGRGLPPPGPDYWEARADQVTIGTAGPLLAGLRSAAALARATGRRAEAARWSAAAGRLAAGIARHFAPYGYPRTPGPGGGADAGVTFLAPPFAPYDPAVARAVRDSARRLTLPNGGILPGEAWQGDRTTAWTPETAFFALAAAASGDAARATRWLDWLADHRTDLGALPEKVDAYGRPVAVAPLAWTAATVVLALVARDRGGLPVPPREFPAGEDDRPAPRGTGSARQARLSGRPGTGGGHGATHRAAAP